MQPPFGSQQTWMGLAWQNGTQRSIYALADI
jgi:hypothetical protein